LYEPRHRSQSEREERVNALIAGTAAVFLVGIGYIYGFSHGVRWTLKKHKTMMEKNSG